MVDTELERFEDDDEPVDEEPLAASSAQGIRMVSHEVRAYSGPLPDPQTLADYKEVDPRFPDAILSAFQQQSSHRQEMERRYMTGSERRANLGQWLGTGLLLSGVVSGVILTLNDHDVTGGITLGASLAVGALSYVFGDYRKKNSED